MTQYVLSAHVTAFCTARHQAACTTIRLPLRLALHLSICAALVLHCYTTYLPHLPRYPYTVEQLTINMAMRMVLRMALPLAAQPVTCICAGQTPFSVYRHRTGSATSCDMKKRRQLNEKTGERSQHRSQSRNLSCISYTEWRTLRAVDRETLGPLPCVRKRVSKTAKNQTRRSATLADPHVRQQPKPVTNKQCVLADLSRPLDVPLDGHSAAPTGQAPLRTADIETSAH